MFLNNMSAAVVVYLRLLASGERGLRLEPASGHFHFREWIYPATIEAVMM